MCLHCFQLIVGPNSDDADQRSRKPIFICNLCVNRHMVPFSIAFKSGLYAILSVSKKKFVLSKCQSAKYAGNVLAT